MRHRYRTILVALTAALTLGAVGASTALAAPEWYSSATKPTPEWWQAGAKLSGTVATKSSGKVTFEDRGEGPLGVTCESSGEGSSEPGAAGKVTTWNLSSCVPTAKVINLKGEEVANKCESVVAAGTKVRNLPWSAELTISKGSLQDSLSAEGTKHPAFKIECNTALGKVSDECTATESHVNPAATNVTGGVNLTFGSEKLYKCSVGGANAGVMQTTQLIAAASGGKLETHVAEGTYSKVTSALSIAGSGELSIEDKGYSSIGLACEHQLTGTVESGGKGTISTITRSNCKLEGACTSLARLETLGLPWKTELIESEGVIREKITSAGETPGVLFECSTPLGTVEDRCSLTASPELVNGLEGNVFARFGEGLPKTSCRLGGSEAGLWRGEFTFTPTSGALKAKK
jgi:hypothetical protein